MVSSDWTGCRGNKSRISGHFIGKGEAKYGGKDQVWKEAEMMVIEKAKNSAGQRPWWHGQHQQCNGRANGCFIHFSYTGIHGWWGKCTTVYKNNTHDCQLVYAYLKTMMGSSFPKWIYTHTYTHSKIYLTMTVHNLIMTVHMGILFSLLLIYAHVGETSFNVAFANSQSHSLSIKLKQW